LSGVSSKVTLSDRHEQYTGYDVESNANQDVRRDVAKAIVNGGFGLLELRPSRLSLEEIFLQLTTEERPAERAEEVQHG
jgi:ABC-2 type transport system ATP-binding protein